MNEIVIRIPSGAALEELGAAALVLLFAVMAMAYMVKGKAGAGWVLGKAWSLVKWVIGLVLDLLQWLILLPFKGIRGALGMGEKKKKK